jgi:ribosome production factor 1
MAKENKRKVAEEAEGGGDGSIGREEKRPRKEKIQASQIKNKEKRSTVYAKLKHEKQIEKRKKIKARDAAYKQAVELGEEARFYFLVHFFGIFRGWL